MMPTMPQTPTTQPPATLSRDPAKYTQANFPSLTPRQLAILAPSDKGRGTCTKHRLGPHTAHQHHLTLWRQGKTHSSDFDQSHTQHHEERDRRAVCPPSTAAGHSTDAIAGPGATAKTDDPAATERAEPIGTDPKRSSSCQRRTCSWMKSG